MNDLFCQVICFEVIEGSYDKWLLGVIIVFIGVGVVMVVFSLIVLMSSLFYYFNCYLIFLVVGIVLVVIVVCIELKFIEQYNQMLLLGCFVLLLVVFVLGLGSMVNGVCCWINLGIFKFQIVEVVKVLYIVWLFSYLVCFCDEVNVIWLVMFKLLGVVGVLVVLLLLQLDFGFLILLLVIIVGMLVLGGVNMLCMLMLVVIGLVGMSVLVIIELYCMCCIILFLDLWVDQQGDGYQLFNVLMVVGCGEWIGVGLGNLVQKLYYLFEVYIDFIFLVIVEEFGFLGICVIVVLYVLLVGCIFWLGMCCVEMKCYFFGYIVFGIGLWISMQIFVFIGVNLGILLIKGLILLLIFFGGLLVLMICVVMGLLLCVFYEFKCVECCQVVCIGGVEEVIVELMDVVVMLVVVSVLVSVELMVVVVVNVVCGISCLQLCIELIFGRLL